MVTKKSRAFVSANGIEAYSDLVDKEIYQVLKKYMQKNKLFIIDGIVSDEVFDKLKKNNEVYAFYVKLDKKERIKRLNKRESLDLEKALKELDIKDNIKIKCGLDIITSKCSALIDSSQTLEKVVDQISDILEKNI